jgi:hypothetical protein
MRSKVLLLAVAGLALSGCLSRADVDALLASQRPPSAVIRHIIVTYARVSLTDPYSVRDAEISSVMTTPDGKVQFVCVNANIRNAQDDYTGAMKFSVRLAGLRPVSINTNAMTCGMPKLRWYPFTELENLKSG